MAADRYRSVDDYLAAQPPPRREQVEALRTLVREAAPELTEIVKWNSPDYTPDGVDRLTINAAGRGPVRLIRFGTERAETKGAAPTFTDDPTGLLTWHSDIRASLKLPPDDRLEARRSAITAVIRAWLAHE